MHRIVFFVIFNCSIITNICVTLGTAVLVYDTQILIVGLLQTMVQHILQLDTFYTQAFLSLFLKNNSLIFQLLILYRNFVENGIFSTSKLFSLHSYFI